MGCWLGNTGLASLILLFFFLNNHHGKCYRSHAVFHLPSYYALYYFPCKKARGCHTKTQTIVPLPQDLQSIYHRIRQVSFWRVVEIFLTERRTNPQNLNLTAWGRTETKVLQLSLLGWTSQWSSLTLWRHTNMSSIISTTSTISCAVEKCLPGQKYMKTFCPNFCRVIHRGSDPSHHKGNSLSGLVPIRNSLFEVWSHM